MTNKPHKPSQKRSGNLSYLRPLRLWNDKSGEQDMRVEIIPLIDVIFCILTFFILAGVGLSRQQAITLDLPQASTGKPQMREMLVVSLDPLGQAYLNKQPYTRPQLEDAMRNFHQKNPGGIIVLNAAKNASYEQVVHVLDLMRQVGGNRVALATVPGNGESTASVENSLPQRANALRVNRIVPSLPALNKKVQPVIPRLP